MKFEPIFPSLADSPYCNASCEYSTLETICQCQECGGLHHGRMRYLSHRKAKIPLGEKVTLISSGGHKAYVRTSELMSEEFKQFLEIADPRELGELFSTKRRGEPTKWGLTVWPLKELGLWSEL